MTFSQRNGLWSSSVIFPLVNVKSEHLGDLLKQSWTGWSYNWDIRRMVKSRCKNLWVNQIEETWVKLQTYSSLKEGSVIEKLCLGPYFVFRNSKYSTVIEKLAVLLWSMRTGSCQRRSTILSLKREWEMLESNVCMSSMKFPSHVHRQCTISSTLV